jgi:hypothetical protein
MDAVLRSLIQISPLKWEGHIPNGRVFSEVVSFEPQ